jgi:predicted nucleic acid-binding Zn finger protein
VAPPEINEKNKVIKKKYKITFTYLDEAKKKRSKTIYFGDETDYVFTGDTKMR